MGTDLADFERSLSDLEVGCTRVAPSEFSEAVTELVREPAVGVELPFDSIHLDDTPVVLDPSPAQLRQARTGVTHASVGIASTGSIVIPTTDAGTEAISVFCEHHIAVLRIADILSDMAQAIDWMGANIAEMRESAVIATGPSATADMGALVRGAHGPRTVEVLLLEGPDRDR